MFKALMLNESTSGPIAQITQVQEAMLPEGDVLVAVSHSSLNYKDGLAIAGKSRVVKSYPMIPGIDFAGQVIESSNADFPVGAPVIHNGWGLGETRWGGYAEKARVNGSWLVKLPKAFTPEQAMAIGTAGYTAMLCVLRLEDAGVRPGDGPILVTGASGGVGSIAISLLSKLGYEVVALTGRMAESDYLTTLGAVRIIDRSGYNSAGKPLTKETWAGAVDSAGGTILANVLAACRYGACVAACGLAGGMDLPTTVAPFILRGVTLAGVDSVYAPIAQRERAWTRMATDLPFEKLEQVSSTITLDEVIATAPKILAGQVRGRMVVKVA
ncbi:MDR family oxidoreductase [Paralcaligenes ureilyticus]|uniref:Acrylyl-CoA reductase (NADPH) n=1 Tax=Paralcaligenes ureilyticus TaxID=627131 RepID=A0A4R3M8Z7_9BURK|nr:MDR family oxidoreductase [Paralcaligenes ureilyticus]TCT09582.1 acrylyl-CoA reductase (NADPH) [Paralcaligenes ureilyticus]